MVKKKKKASTAKNKRKKQPRRKSLPQYLELPDTTDGSTKVWITTATLQDIHQAAKKRRPPFLRKRAQYLVTVPSASVRNQVYQQAALAWQRLEERLLPHYGGRGWHVEVRITDAAPSKSSPWFVFTNSGQMELAVWPHLLHKIPAPPRFPGYTTSSNSSSSSNKRARSSRSNQDDEDDDEDDDMEDDDEEESDEEESETEEDVRIQELLDREVTPLSQLAYDERWRVPCPHVSIKWISPLHQIFTTRKSAYDNAVQLCRNEVLLDKMLTGYGANGKPVTSCTKKAPPSKRACLKAGRVRFERDGLWVVGQCQAWQVERLRQEGYDVDNNNNNNHDNDDQSTTNDNAKPAAATAAAAANDDESSKQLRKNKRVTPLAFYLECNRKQHQQKRLQELRLVEAVAASHNSQAASTTTTTTTATESTTTTTTTTLNLDSAVEHVESIPLEKKSSSTDKDDVRMAHVEDHNSVAALAATTTTTTTTAGADVAGSAMVSPSAIEVADRSNTNQNEKSLQEASSMKEEDTSKIEDVEMAVGDSLDTAVGSSVTSPVAEDVSGANGVTKVVATTAIEANPTETNDTDAKRSNNGNSTCKPNASQAEEGRPQKLPAVSFTLRDAERELRYIWKTLSDEERQVWAERNKQNQLESATKPEGDTCARADASLQKDKAGTSDAGRVTPSECENDPTGITCSSPKGATDIIGVDSSTNMGKKGEQATSTTIIAPSPPPTNLNEKLAGVEATMVAPQEADSSAAAQKTKDDASKDAKPAARQTPKRPLPKAVREFIKARHWRLNEDQVSLCYNAGMEHFDQIMRTVKARDLTRELQDGFDLLRERGRGRYDMELPAFDEPTFNFLTDIKKAPWMPIVREILGKDVVLIHKGMFLSLPGAKKQEYHQDGPHLTTQYQKPCHAINVFIPLVDLSMQHGPTEFCLGSHILGQEDYDRDFLETPTVTAGTPIIFDYRLGHKGLGNSSPSCRPIVYCTYARAADGKEFRDSVNFSRKRYHRIGDLVSKVPSREERAKKRGRLFEEHESESEASHASLETDVGSSNDRTEDSRDAKRRRKDSEHN